MSIHAEEMALDKIKICDKKLKVSLLVIRIKEASNPNSYSLTSSRPCIACMYRIKNNTKLNITKLYFSNENGEIIYHKVRDFIKEKQHIPLFYKKIKICKKFLKEFEVE